MYTISVDVGTKNLAYVIIDKELKIQQWDVVDISKYSTSGLITYFQTLFVNDLFNAETVNLVLIEKQPSRNTKMRVMENSLTMFFHMSGMKKVLNYSAKKKLGSIGATVKGSKNYSMRKKYSTYMTIAFLKTHAIDFLKLFECHKKKDDLADCLLQAISYLNNSLVDELSKCIVQLDVE